MEYTKETAEQFVKGVLKRNGFEENHDGRFIKDKCIITFEEECYKVTNYNEDYLEWLDWFSHDLNIYSLMGYLSWNDFIERGYNK